MSQPIHLSDELLLEARQCAKKSRRTLTDQIEWWVNLGRAIEPLVQSEHPTDGQAGREVKSLSDLIGNIDSEQGRLQVRGFLAEQPFPHFEAVPDHPGLLKKIDADGTETIGRFEDRRFEPVDP